MAGPCSRGRPMLDKCTATMLRYSVSKPTDKGTTMISASSACPTPSRRSTTTYGGLVAESSGLADGRAPLVVLHGLTFDRTIWGSVLDELDVIDPGRRTVAFDLPDHGLSAPLASHDL